MEPDPHACNGGKVLSLLEIAHYQDYISLLIIWVFFATPSIWNL